MGLLERFRRSLSLQPGGSVLAPPRPLRPADSALAEITQANGLAAAIEVAMRKNMNYQGFQATDQTDDQGGYYGPEFDIRSTAGRIKALYGREPWIYSAATVIARTLSSIPMRVYPLGGDKPVPDKHPLAQLIRSPGEFQDARSLAWVTALDDSLAGNSFTILSDDMKRVVGHAPVELTNLRFDAQRRQVVGIELFDNTVAAASQRGRFVDIQFVVHRKLPNPYSPFFGFSPFAAAARPILLDRYKSEFEMAFYLRGATSSGVVEMTEDMSKSRFDRMMATFEAAFTGRANWWRTLFLPKGAKWVKSSLTMAEMQHLEGLKENRKTILAVLGIPPSMLGLIEDVNRATADQQERIFYNNTIVPMAWFVASGWNGSFLLRNVYKGLEVRPDFTGIPAVEGSVSDRLEKATAMQPYFTIDEIRQQVWGQDPMPEGRGDRLVAEVGGGGGGVFSLSAPAPEAKIADEAAMEAAPEPDTEFQDAKAAEKVEAAASQNRLERKVGAEYERGLDRYVDELLAQAKKALGEGRDVRTYLHAKRADREGVYLQAAGPALEKALERGFSAGSAMVKKHVQVSEKRVQFAPLSEQDRQAIDVLRERTREGQRKALVQRAIDAFRGFDETRTEAIMQIIEDGAREGRTFEQIARDIRDTYGERYRNQSRTIVRTEVLSAVSQGLKWNHEVLGKVFTEVKKQWLSQGDADVNPDARDEHAAFEEEGEVSSAHEWVGADGSRLAYPRDPRGSAGQVINCRCTMISVIPPESQSNADAILELEP